MSDFDDLKKYLGEIGKILKRIFLAKLEILTKGDAKKKKIFLYGSGILIILFIGMGIGSMLSGGGDTGTTPKQSKGGGFSIIKFFFKRTIHVPGFQEDGTFVFADFETELDLQAWKLLSSKMDLVAKKAGNGKQSAHITFLSGADVSGIQLDDYFESRKALSNWSRFHSLKFHINNPRKVKERLILQIKDRHDKRYKQDLYLQPGATEDFSISLERVGNFIDIQRIEQVTLFRWKPKSDRDIYIDHIRLVPIEAILKSRATEKKLEVPIKDRPVKPMDYGFSAKKTAWTVRDPHAGTQYVRIPFIASNESNSPCLQCAFEGGMPLPMGEVSDLEQLRVRNTRGEIIPIQTSIVAKWPDQSLKWIKLHLITDLAPKQGMGYFLEYGKTITPSKFPSKLSIVNADKEITIDTNIAQYVFSKSKFFAFETVSLDLNLNGAYEPGEVLVRDVPFILQFDDRKYKTAVKSSEYEIKIEEQGPQKVVLRAQGWFYDTKGHRFCQAIVRYTFVGGQASAKIDHTLIYTGYPENIYYDNYKGLKLPKNEALQSFGLKIGLEALPSEIKHVRAGMRQSGFKDFSAAGKSGIMQSAWDMATAHRDQAAERLLDEPTGWFDISTPKMGFTLAVRHFRENFPKAYRFDSADGSLKLDLWPEEAGLLDFATTSNALGPEARARGSAFGLAKTHQILFYPHAGNVPVTHIAAKASSFSYRHLLRANPYWIDATGVFGRIMPIDQQRYATEEKTVEALFDWAARHPKDFKWYGMLNFGDTLTWWRNEDGDQWYGDHGWHPIGRWGWYNCEGIGLHAGALLQFIRTGKWKYFEFGENLARHLMDVDTVHYNTVANDKRLKRLISDEFSKVGSMHRHNGDHWGGRNEEASHTSLVGLLMYHLITGDMRAWDVVQEIGEFFLTEPFTYTGHPDVAPHRAMANALWGDVLMFQITGDDRYKKAADKLIDIYLRGQQSDGSILEVYNPISDTWSGKKHRLYMEGYALGAIMSYHELTQDEEVKNMLLQLVRYLGKSGSGPSSLHGYAYAYFISGDASFLEMLDKGLNELIRKQLHSGESMHDGLIYKKPIYHRPNAYLYPAGYAYAALDASRKGGKP